MWVAVVGTIISGRDGVPREAGSKRPIPITIRLIASLIAFRDSLEGIPASTSESLL